MKIKPIHLALGGAALYLGYRALNKPSSSAEEETDPGNGNGNGQGVGPLPSTTPLLWNDGTAAKVKTAAQGIYDGLPAEQQEISPGRMFMVTRDSVMQVWPGLPWPKTMSSLEEIPNVERPDQGNIPKWVVQAGQIGPAMNVIWEGSKGIVHEIYQYLPTT